MWPTSKAVAMDNLRMQPSLSGDYYMQPTDWISLKVQKFHRYRSWQSHTPTDNNCENGNGTKTVKQKQ